jgi:hypothetical protein
VRVIWNGTDITAYCDVTGCVHRDAAGGRNDSLELEMDRPEAWYRWAPEEGDEIEVTQDGYTTGTMYLTAVIPCGDRYRILAGSVKPAGNRKTWAGYENNSFRAIAERCAAECGMQAKIFGMDEDLIIPYCMRRDEGCAAFLTRIGRAEGFRIKAYNGVFRAIYLPWAEGLDPVSRITITADQKGVNYRRRGSAKYTALTVRTPWAEATARDPAAPGNNPAVVTSLPAGDAATAGRWARHLLRDHNRKAEELRTEQRLDTRLTALARVSVNGGTDMDGEWIVEEAEHDLYNRSTVARMFRITDTVR